MNYPLLISVLTFLSLWGAALLGSALRRRRTGPEHGEGEFGIVLGATLTLMGLLIGFSFSMATTRYDLRKNYEEEEANAIGTEYLRADLLPDPARQQIKGQLLQYLDLRIRRYDVHASHNVTDMGLETTRLQNQMWAEVKNIALLNPNPLTATVVTGMNDVINRQGYTQAARLNRIPLPAWGLMSVIALFCSFLIGFGEKKPRNHMLIIVPLAIAVSFLLIADIDSPNGGLIRVAPQNLIDLASSLKVQ
jgi:hypothetical protein